MNVHLSLLVVFMVAISSSGAPAARSACGKARE